jgi:hypothetical protein
MAWRSRTGACLPAHTGAIAYPGGCRTATRYGNLRDLAQKPATLLETLELLYFENQLVNIDKAFSNYLAQVEIAFPPRRGGPGWGQKGWIFDLISKNYVLLNFIVKNNLQSCRLSPTPTPPRWGGASS